MKKHYALLLLTSCALNSYAQLAQQEVAQQLQERSDEVEQASEVEQKEHRTHLTREEFDNEVNERRKVLAQLQQRVQDDKPHYERVAQGLKEVCTDQLMQDIADDVNALYTKYVLAITTALRDKLSDQDVQKLSEFIALFKDCQILQFKPDVTRVELVKASITLDFLRNAYLSATPQGDTQPAGVILSKPFEGNYVRLLGLLDKQIEILNQK